jgi:hypothetical protein
VYPPSEPVVVDIVLRIRIWSSAFAFSKPLRTRTSKTRRGSSSPRSTPFFRADLSASLPNASSAAISATFSHRLISASAPSIFETNSS